MLWSANFSGSPHESNISRVSTYLATVASVKFDHAHPRTSALRLIASTAILLTVLTGCGTSTPQHQKDQSTDVSVEHLTVIAEFPHDPTAFTEGLEFDGPALYESTGLLGQSQLREIDPATGAVLRAASLPPEFFGEGIAVVGDRIWQLTWRNGVAIEWDKSTLTPLRNVPMNGEGWGLCYDGQRLVRSDGTNKLHFHDPTSFAETGSVDVTYMGNPYFLLNELECVDGQVYANVFGTDQIARIDPTSGQVVAIVNASGLLDDARRAHTDDVLNGIAYAGNGEYVLTGKNWPTMFRVRFGGG